MKIKIVTAAILAAGLASSANAQQIGGYWQDQYGQTTVTAHPAHAAEALGIGVSALEMAMRADFPLRRPVAMTDWAAA